MMRKIYYVTKKNSFYFFVYRDSFFYSILNETFLKHIYNVKTSLCFLTWVTHYFKKSIEKKSHTDSGEAKRHGKNKVSSHSAFSIFFIDCIL